MIDLVQLGCYIAHLYYLALFVVGALEYILSQRFARQNSVPTDSLIDNLQTKVQPLQAINLKVELKKLPWVKFIIFNFFGAALIYSLWLGKKITEKDREANLAEIESNWSNTFGDINSEPMLEHVTSDYFNIIGQTETFLDENQKSKLDFLAGGGFDIHKSTSIQEVAIVLLKDRKFDKEFQLLEITTTNDLIGYESYLDYVYEHYYTHFQFLRETNQFNRLKWYANETIKRLLLYDVTPVGQGSEGYLYNTMLLTSLIYSDSEVNYKFSNELAALENDLNTRFSEGVTIIDGNKNKFLNELTSYFKVIHLFQNNDLKEAALIADNLANSKNNLINNLSRLLKSRIIFWSTQANDTDKVKSIKSINELSKACTIKSFKTDMEEYVNILTTEK